MDSLPCVLRPAGPTSVARPGPGGPYDEQVGEKGALAEKEGLERVGSRRRELSLNTE